MFCPHCGKENDNKSVFCAACGIRINESPAAPPQAVPAKNYAPLIKKETMIKFSLASVLVLLYAGISIIFIMLLTFEDSITVNTVFNSSLSKDLTLEELLEILISGNKIFNPTPLSTALGVGLYALVYSLPAFALIALIGAFIGKKTFAFYTVSSIITVLTAAIVTLITPLSVMLIPDFKQVIARSVGVIVGDVDNVTFVPIIIFVAIALVLLIAAGIVTRIFNKRRAQ